MSDREVRSETDTIAAGSSGTALGFMEFRGSMTLRPSTVVITYPEAATNETIVTLYDEEHSNPNGNSQNAFFAVAMSPGDDFVVEHADLGEVYRGIVVQSSNNDDDVVVNVGGKVVTG